MTLGINLSSLFTDMVKISRTTDIIIKKMVYLYLVNYSANNQECVILAMNAFLTDCKDGDYKIRALAIRTLSSIQYSGALSYIQDALNAGLKDQNSYVRKTAVIGCIKLFRYSPDIIKEGGYIETLYVLLKDSDPQVVINAMMALNEVLENEGGILITRKLVIYLINRLKDFNDWGQALVIEVIGRYTPKNESEAVDVLSILEEILTYSNASVLLAVIKVFLKYSKCLPEMSKQILERLQAPLITLMTSAESSEYFELTYAILQHIHLIAERYGAKYKLFQGDYKHFFCKMGEGSHIKELKVEILGYIANEVNIQEILNELNEYVIDVNSELAKKAINCICYIAAHIPSMIQHTMQVLLKFFNYHIEYISSESIIACSLLLRKYPEFSDSLVREISDLHSLISKEEAKIALIWVLGEYGEKIPSAPYVLEYYSSLSPNDSISYALLTAIIKVFFKRPKECKDILKRILKVLLINSDNSDLKAKATMYFNLLRTDIEQAKNIILGGENKGIDEFWEDENNEEKEKIEAEFNTCSVIYSKPQIKFMKQGYIRKDIQINNLNLIIEEPKEDARTIVETSITKDLLVCIHINN
jgi:AP-4 complex subunit beta-1